MTETPQLSESAALSADLDLAEAEAFEHLADLARAWGGDYRRVDPDETLEDGGDADARIVLPVQAGMRHGALLVDVHARRLGDGRRTRLELDVARSDYHLPKASLFVLTAGLAGAVLMVALPLVPHLVGLLPLALALLLLAWFLVLARVKYRGIREFADELRSSSRSGGETA
ncbi:MAG: hypothetical protein DWQ36_11795 [Acidobacteria bacterium]|nr:MAG: hypothetical protein DWQ30_02680 [Acidobacteriota bacterium]REK07408.1 MAG: hypothetical protein DWQ36_11795 [Acidobacteriota bacterium]